jgi:ComF family protein
VVCAVPYAFPWDQLIAGFKYQEQLDLAAALAAVLTHAVQQAHPQGPPVDMVVAMPLAPQRLAERGYNQAWELARRVAQRFKLPAQPCALMRTVTTAPQARLSRQARLSQLQGVFSLAPEARAAIKGRRLALVDDVMTTGASARAATRVLRQAGVASVEVWSLARTD